MGDEADYQYEQYIDSLGMEDDGMGEPDAPAFKTCRYCGKTGFEWGIHDGKWRLQDHNGVHQCLVKPLPEKPKPREITDPVEKAFRAGFDAGHRSAEDKAYPDVGFSMPMSLEQAWREYGKPQVIKLANGSKITAAKSPHNPVRGFAPPTDEDIPL